MQSFLSSRKILLLFSLVHFSFLFSFLPFPFFLSRGVSIFPKFFLAVPLSVI